MKKFISLFCVMILAVSMLAACGGGEDNASGGDNKVTIEYWHTQTEEVRVQTIKDLIAKFEDQNPNITVKQIPVSEDDFSTKTSASLAAGKMPAILEAGIDQLLFLGSQGVIDNKLNEEIINEIGKDKFYDAVLNTVKAQDVEGYNGVPFTGWVQGIWYRKDLFEEKGLEPPTTWDNILAAAKAFHDPANKQYGIVFGTQKDGFAEQTFSQFALSNNAHVYDEDGNINFNSPEMIETLKFYNELSGYTPPGSEGWREARENYLSNRAPMIMYSSYIMSDLVANDLADKTGFAVPEKDTKATFGQITSLSITKHVSDEQKAAAKKFIKFLFEKDNYIKYLHMSPGGNNPTLKAIAKDPAYLDNEVLKAYGEESTTIATGLKDLKRFGLRDGKMYPSMGDISAKFIIGEAINNITQHGDPVEDVVKSAQEKMEQLTK